MTKSGRIRKISTSWTDSSSCDDPANKIESVGHANDRPCSSFFWLATTIITPFTITCSLSPLYYYTFRITFNHLNYNKIDRGFLSDQMLKKQKIANQKGVWHHEEMKWNKNEKNFKMNRMHLEHIFGTEQKTMCRWWLTNNLHIRSNFFLFHSHAFRFG